MSFRHFSTLNWKELRTHITNVISRSYGYYNSLHLMLRKLAFRFSSYKNNQAWLLLSAMKPEQFRNIHNDVYGFYSVMSLYSNILAYALNLKNILSIIENNKEITGLSIKTELKEISLSAFFRDNNNMLLNAEEVFSKFKTSSIKCLEIYEGLNKRNDLTLKEERYLQVLQGFNANLKGIAELFANII